MSVDQLSLFAALQPTPRPEKTEPQKSAIDRARSGEAINIMDLIEERKEQKPAAPVEDAKTAAATLAPAAAEPKKEFKTLADYLPDPQYNFKSGRCYSGENLWILDEAQKENNFTSNMWLGFYQARDLGGHVKKGSKGTCIKVYKTYQKQDEENPNKKENRTYFKNEYVFNLDQIQFKTDPEPPALEPITDQIRPRAEKTENKPAATPKVKNAISTPAAAAAKPSEDLKKINQFTNMLRRRIPGLEKFITTEREKLRTKPTHTRRMMAQYESKLYTVNIKEFYLNLYTNLLSREITAADVETFDLMDKHSYYTVSIRFNSERWREYVNGKEYAFPHNASAQTKKEIETVYNWIQENLKVDPAKIKADKLAKAERDAKNLHGIIDGFHSTPAELADKLISKIDILHNHKILEPSAGIGALADKVREYAAQHNIKNVSIDVCEASQTLREVLELKEYNIISNDFTKLPAAEKYDLIIMNPPFEKGVDIEHIQHAFKMLTPGGRLIAIMAAGNMTKDQKKYREFQDFVNDNGGYTERVDAGAFKESRTMVSSMILKLEK